MYCVLCFIRKLYMSHVPNLTIKIVLAQGLLYCNGGAIDSEVIYWKIVPGDRTYESPITPHHEDHHDKYLTFEYDAGGWNNVRMGMECLLVIAHATGNRVTGCSVGVPLYCVSWCVCTSGVTILCQPLHSTTWQ